MRSYWQFWKPSARHIHPLAVRAKIGSDMSRHVPKHLDQFRGQAFDRIIILCDQGHEECPTLDSPGAIYWNTPDPILFEGTEEQRQRAFHQLAMGLSTRICLLLILLEREKRSST